MPQPFRLPRLVLALLTTLLAFGTLELGLWLMGEGYRLWMHLQRPDPARSDAPALVCAGDSVTFGLGADTDQAWPAVLARMPPYAGLDVLNVSVAGIDRRTLAAHLDRELAARPSLGGGRLLVLAGYNDCAHLPGMATLDPGAGGSGSLRRLLAASRGYQLLTQVVLRGRARWSPPASAGERFRQPDGDLEGDRARCTAVLDAGLGMLEEVAGRHDLALMLVAYPVPRIRTEGTPTVTSRVNEITAEEAAERGLPWLDVEPCVLQREAEAGRGFFEADGIHLFAEGYAALATCVAEALDPWLE